MLFVAVVIALVSAPGGQAPRNDEVVQGLRAPDVRLRMDSAADLVRRSDEDPSILADRAVQKTVVALLETENTAIAEGVAMRLAGGGSAHRDETYSEYYAQVLGLANRIRKDYRPADGVLVRRLLRALVRGTYNPDSSFVTDLAGEGEAIVPLVLELSRAADGPSKWNAFGLTEELFLQHDARAPSAQLAERSLASLRAVARGGLVDPAPDVRLWAIRAVSSARDKDAIPMLERMAGNDPDAGPGRYSVRRQAAEALSRLR
jgi:hypothetical protein